MIFSALLLSWIVSVMVAPLFGYYLIKPKITQTRKPLYQSRFYRLFRQVLEKCLTHYRAVIAATVIAFVVSVGMLRWIPQEFFPPSLRPEIIVEMTLPEGSSLAATQQEAQRFSTYLRQHTKEMKSYSYYVGEGAPRFVLTWEPVLPASNYAQFIIVADDLQSRACLLYTSPSPRDRG